MSRPVLLLALACSGCLAHHSGPMPDEPDATYATLLDTRVRYDVRGQGPAVLLIHGFASALETWRTVVPALEADYTVIRLDLKGFGWTDRPEGDYSPEAQAAICLALLDKLGVRSAAVVGHSWGASVALAVALAAPERVSKLVLYDAWAYAEQLPSFFWWSRTPGLGESLFWLFYKQRAEDRIAMAFYDQRYVTQDFVDAIEAALERPATVAGALEAARGQHYEELAPQYKTIAAPTLLLWGREDKVSPPWVGERLQNELPNARLETFGQCGHFPMIESVHASNRALRDFLVAVTP